MNNIAIYTCITGGYDTPTDNFDHKEGYDYILFSNTPISTKSWKNVVVQFNRTDTPTNVKKQRFVKTHPFEALKDYDIAVWVDANTAIDQRLYNYINANKDNIITFKVHPQRDCIYAEADEVNKRGKETPEACEKVKEFLKNENYPQHNGLYETNIIISHPNDENVKKLLSAWWNNIAKYSHRDQLTLNYTIWKLQLENIITCQKTKDFPPRKHTRQ